MHGPYITDNREELSDLLPQAMIIQGDGTDKDLLLEEGLTTTEAFVAMITLRPCAIVMEPL